MFLQMELCLLLFLLLSHQLPLARIVLLGAHKLLVRGLDQGFVVDNWGKGYVENLAIDARIDAETTEKTCWLSFNLRLNIYSLNLHPQYIHVAVFLSFFIS